MSRDMHLQIYAIYDKKSERFDTPFFSSSDLFAIRRFQIIAQEKNSPLRLWPGEFELHRVATFNIETGEVNEEDSKVIHQGYDDLSTATPKTVEELRRDLRAAEKQRWQASDDDVPV